MRRLRESAPCRSSAANLKRRLSTVAVAATTLSLALSSTALAAQNCEMTLHGINVAGAEFGQPGDPYGQGYIYPSKDTIDSLAKDKFNAIRLPFLWERLQPSLNGVFDATELSRMQATISAARDNNMVVILDPHNYARYRGQVIGSPDVPVEAFADFWKRLSAVFANDDDIIFGLMNEPHDIEAPEWLTAANAAIAAIRNIGAGNLIFVPGTAWTGAHSWEQTFYGPSNASVMTGVVDPQDNFAFEVHQYADADYSGKADDCSHIDGAVDAVRSFTDWLNTNNYQGFLGEFGTTDQIDCLRGLKQIVDIIQNDQKAWIGWAYWASGDWWPKNAPMIIQPDLRNGGSAQLRTLQPMLAGNDMTRHACNGDGN
ncbi:glycoside hydrolase family 5 protein [Martelella lutilitoris]|uniref:Glycoside hydrolase family 5 protein n=1 Tax=Martelella lutilitoris TaxID=2583532 RepID=A0A7T7KM61_9HYPH|nr:glycoside hydrolase family 5 protein [Martelella lutilitoris]QQM31233.1 glycoside hydrolase family 5 protein [Martelella lutilitoris]